MIDYKKIKKYMILGLIGAFITVFAEMLQGTIPSRNAADKVTALFSSFDNLAVWRIGVGSTVGAIGILMQFFGVYAIYLSFEDKTAKGAKVYHAGMYVFSVLGAIVHILMSFMIYGYKISMNAMMEVTIWFVLPLVVLFFVGYIPFAIAMAIQFFKRRTPFPKWMFVLNPLFGKAFFNAITSVLPSSAIVNGISFSNMGLSSVILFTVCLCMMRRSENAEQ